METMTQAERWQAKFKQALNKDRAHSELEAHGFVPFATLFTNAKQKTGRCLDATIIIGEFFLLPDGSIFDSRSEVAVAVTAPIEKLDKDAVLKVIKNEADKVALETAKWWPVAA